MLTKVVYFNASVILVT